MLIDYAARWTDGEPAAGDDAADARFVSRDEAMALVEWDETRRVIAEAYERFGAAGATCARAPIPDISSMTLIDAQRPAPSARTP